MAKIEVDAITAMIDGQDTEQGEATGWGWTHWDGPELGKLYIVYRCSERYPEDDRASFWYEVYIQGEYHAELPQQTDFRQWALEQGWRPVISYTSEGGRAG